MAQPPDAHRAHAEVAACLIVKNEEETLEQCLASVRPHVDEVCVFDTGSTDNTVALLERLAAAPGAPIRVERGEWRNDYADARKQSFALASSDWAIWVDADDELIGGENVRALVGIASDRAADFITVLYDCWDQGDGTVHHSWRERILRRGSGQWSERMHELYRVPDINRCVVAHPGAFYVRHTSRSSEIQRRIDEGRTRLYYFEALQEAAEHPEDSPRALLLLGCTLMAYGDYAPAADALERYLAGGFDAIEGRWNLQRAEALRRLADCHHKLGDDHAAEGRRTEALKYEATLRTADAQGKTDPTRGARLFDFGAAWLRTRTPSNDLTLEGPLVRGRHVPRTPGRNEPCWCGSGRKFKRCHGA